MNIDFDYNNNAVGYHVEHEKQNIHNFPCGRLIYNQEYKMHSPTQRKIRFMKWDNLGHKFIGDCTVLYCVLLNMKMNRCMNCKWFAVGHYYVSLFEPLMLISMKCIHSIVLHCVILIMLSILEWSSLNILFIYCSDRLLRRICTFLFQTNRAWP